MAHTLATHPAVRDLHATTIANYSFEFGALVLPTGAFPVALGAENPLTEKSVLFRAVSAVVDGFRLADFTKRPTSNIVGAG